ncbi:MAG: ATP-dependent DNA helicase RecG, partial [Gammaproteobacteria bacterium]
LRARGVVRMGRFGWEMAHPKLQSADAPKQAVAIYPSIGKMPQATIRQYVSRALEMFDGAETVAKDLRDFDGGDWTTKDALTFIHQPPPNLAHLAGDREHPAWRRLRFDELLAHQIVLRRRYHRRIRQTAEAITTPPFAEKLYAHLPFSPTAAQHRAVGEVCADMAKTTPMRRLLQGDVGSGKTLVAAVACLACALQKRTAAFMAPTSILARQHYETLSEWFAPANVKCELFSAEVRGKNRREAESRLRFGLSNIAIGTHALFQENVKLPHLSLAVADEQHRFGVEQRLALAEKGGGVHQLMMSATPIPRTLAMGVFADLDISVLDEKPPGRATVSTTLIPASRRTEVLARIAARKEQGGRAFWICPRISESPGESASEKEYAKAEKAQLANAESVVKEARAHHPQLMPQVVHGKTPAAEKSKVLEDFRRGKSALLVATTVVEVGVDVPDADVMVVENAERMGLSQLHQLRGRVGRGGKSGYCILLYDGNLSAAAKERLKILRDSDDGFAIARRDLQLRGPGEWLGLRQSGMPMLKAAKLIEAEDIRKAARFAADAMLSNHLRAAVSHTRRWLGKTAKLARS